MDKILPYITWIEHVISSENSSINLNYVKNIATQGFLGNLATQSLMVRHGPHTDKNSRFFYCKDMSYSTNYGG